jgi:hypothetical protein
MSHHLDTPLAAQTGQLYIDDLYVFPGSHPAAGPVRDRITGGRVLVPPPDGQGTFYYGSRSGPDAGEMRPNRRTAG